MAIVVVIDENNYAVDLVNIELSIDNRGGGDNYGSGGARETHIVFL